MQAFFCITSSTVVFLVDIVSSTLNFFFGFDIPLVSSYVIIQLINLSVSPPIETVDGYGGFVDHYISVHGYNPADFHPDLFSNSMGPSGDDGGIGFASTASSGVDYADEVF